MAQWYLPGPERARAREPARARARETAAAGAGAAAGAAAEWAAAAAIGPKPFAVQSSPNRPSPSRLLRKEVFSSCSLRPSCPLRSLLLRGEASAIHQRTAVTAWQPQSQRFVGESPM